MDMPASLNDVVNTFYYEEDRYNIPQAPAEYDKLCQGLKQYFNDLMSDNLIATITDVEVRSVLFPEYMAVNVQGILKLSDYTSVSSVVAGLQWYINEVRRGAQKYRNADMDYMWIKLEAPDATEHITFNSNSNTGMPLLINHSVNDRFHADTPSTPLDNIALYKKIKEYGTGTCKFYMTIWYH